MNGEQHAGKAMAALCGAGVAALTGLVLTGNCLVASPVLGLWTYAELAFAGCRDERAASPNRRRPASVPVNLAIRKPWVMAGVVWTAVLLLGSYRTANNSRPTDAEVAWHMSKAEGLFRAGDLRKALAAYQTLDVPVALPARRAQKCHNIGIILMRLQRWDEAEAAFGEAIGYDPHNFDAYYNLGRLTARRNDHQVAREWLGKALQFQPEHTGAWQLLAQSLLESGDFREALVAITRAETAAAPDDPHKEEIRRLKARIEFRVSLFD
jgi:tetratricopeptide (TPR) repeat protein